MALLELPFCMVGTGSISRAFALAFSKANIRISAVASRTSKSASNFANEINEHGKGKQQLVQLVLNSDAQTTEPQPAIHSERCAVLVAVPDFALDDHLCHKIRQLLPNVEYAIHTSGALRSSVLSGICPKHASLHPCAAFPRDAHVPMEMAGVLIGVEGSSRSVEEQGMQLVRRIGGKPFKIDRERKASYHAACTMSSNFVWTLVHNSMETMVSSGVDKTTAKQIAEGLLQSTLHSVQNTNADSIGDALTGPIVRGDVGSVRSHLAQLRENEDESTSLYEQLAHATAMAAYKEGRITKATLQSILSSIASQADGKKQNELDQ